MSVKLLTEQHLEFLSLKGGCTGSSESTLVKMPHCWKSHVTAHIYSNFIIVSSKNVNHNLSRWFCGINIMPAVFWSQSRCQIMEINKTITLGHRSLETGITSKIE